VCSLCLTSLKVKIRQRLRGVRELWHTHTHVCNHTYTHVCNHIHTHMCTQTHMYAIIHTHTHTCMQSHTHTHVSHHTHTHMYADTHHQDTLKDTQHTHTRAHTSTWHTKAHTTTQKYWIRVHTSGDGLEKVSKNGFLKTLQVGNVGFALIIKTTVGTCVRRRFHEWVICNIRPKSHTHSQIHACTLAA